ncbi:GNAT family N-acetyltransferase [Ferroacidibacillus organovorans]|uniref:GNAT family N-acetyltransferase n=1 Tax=Ferroacidibacillus organovorans TaxID=1765683 RepID=UPI001E64EC12|nr:GNAT family N-acetyltransferase [Ferroacidibacillus organovorans]
MSCRLAFFSQEWESSVGNFKLHDSQMVFSFLPSKALDFFHNQDACSVVIFIDEEPVVFFVLHKCGETSDFTENNTAIFLRSFLIDKRHQRKGYAKLALAILPKFMEDHLPYVEEIVLTVDENNLAAKRLYEKSGFIHKGRTKVGRSGLELGMHYSLKGS